MKILKQITSATLAAVLIIPLAFGTLVANAQDNTTKNKPPVINGLSAPTALAINSEGKFTVNAYDPEGGNLTYAVDFGEKSNASLLSRLLPINFVQTATFYHTYSSSGIKTITYTVKDEDGATAKSSITVRVTGDAVTPIAITDVNESSVEARKATIEWNTNVKANAKIWYGTSSPIDAKGDANISQNDNSTKHKIQLKDLQPNTTYYYVVKSEASNNANGSTVSSEGSFTTKASANQTPIARISDGPKSLDVNETGTWTLKAADPENRSLSYYVIWGDENNAETASLRGREPIYVQTSTFEHSYAAAGTYNITFMVKNDLGVTSEVKTKVTVDSDNNGTSTKSSVGATIKSWFGSRTSQNDSDNRSFRGFFSRFFNR